MKYVRCDSHCKFPAYDKEEIDDLLLNKVYPIGSVYIGINEINPSTLFGGEWEQIKDTFLLSAGDVYEAGSTGGEAEHTLTIEEMPTHIHGHKIGYGTGSNTSHYTAVENKNISDTIENTEILPSGGDKPHNNMPPYLTVYMWKRIA